MSFAELDGSILVTGGAGFIGSNIVKRLLKNGCNVTVYDNLSTGKTEHLKDFMNNDCFTFVKGDLLDKGALEDVMKGKSFVFHLAANADIRYGSNHTGYDMTQNTIATYNVLEAMRKHNVKKMVFTSTSATFGETNVIPTPESYGPALPASLYGASKLACEGFISAYCSLYGMKAWIFRLANIIGPNVTHGILADFEKKLKDNPHELEVLGDGNQTKSYLYVDDCIDAMLLAVAKTNDAVNFFNLGSDDQITVKEITDIVVNKLSPEAKIRYTGGSYGWNGDVPKMMLDNRKIKSIGWRPRHNSRKAVLESVKSL